MLKQYGGLVENRELNYYVTLIQYDGAALLVHLQNNQGHDVLETWVDVDDDKSIYRYMQVTLSPQRMNAFIEGRLSLRNAFKESFTVFIVDRLVHYVDDKTYIISTKDLPDDYFADEDTYDSYVLAYVELVMNS